MSTFTMVRAEPGGCKAPPFAQLPHDIAADPRLTPVDVRVIAALLFWARDKAACWPCDASIAARVGRSVSTVQRALRRLQALGLVQREQVPQSDANRTGRILRLRWRVDRTPGHGCPALRSSLTADPQSPVTDEGRIERERETAEAGPGPESPSPTAEDLELWRGWAEGSNPTLARIGRAALATAGVVEPPCPAPVTEPADYRPEGPEVLGATEPRCQELPVPEPRGTRCERSRGPEVPTSAGPYAPKVPRPEVPTSQRPVAPRCPVPSAPIAGGAAVRECRRPQAPRPPGTPGPWNLGTLALRLGGALAREGPRS